MPSKPIWLVRPLGLAAVRKQTELMELETQRFYEAAALRATDAGIRQLLGDLAAEERKHTNLAEELEGRGAPPARQDEEAATRAPPVRAPGRSAGPGRPDGWLGLDAGAALRRRLRHHESWKTFLVGLAASLGAGISMGFAEALSDDGSLTGRGHPGLAARLRAHDRPGRAGAHAPLPDPALPDGDRDRGRRGHGRARAIAWVRHRYMDTPLGPALVQVVVGGILVFLTGVLIGIS